MKLGSTLFNTIDKFGLGSIILHWVTALTVIGLFGLGWYMVDLTYYDALYNRLPFIHKSIGILLAILFVSGWIWRSLNEKPKPLGLSSQFEVLAARVAHFLLSALILLIIISGYLIPTAKGSAISVFGWFDLPAIVSHLPQQEEIAGLIHRYLSWALGGLVVLHATAALKHHFFNKDDTLKRMLGSGSK